MSLWEKFKVWASELFYYSKGQPGIASAIEASAQAEDPNFVGPVYPIERAVGDVVESITGAVSNVWKKLKGPVVVIIAVLAGITIINLIKK